ncbi:MAG: dihydroorotase family protein [Spirochaetales bacterium]|nr:dihydroorotase family protein [Spirochaetales bacterium]
MTEDENSMTGSLLVQNSLLNGRKMDILIESGIISRIERAGTISESKLTSDGCMKIKRVDAEGRAIIPGLIDPHVHFRCPGMEYKEDWISGSRAALAGGVTTVFDMPNNKPAIETMEALLLKRDAALRSDKAGIRLGRFFWVGTSPDNIQELPALLLEKDVVGVKLFFSESSGNNSSSERAFLKTVFRAAAHEQKIVAVHTEMAELLAQSAVGSDFSNLELHNRMRPDRAAEAGTKLALELSAETGAKVYICHVSTRGEFLSIKNHRKIYGADSVFAELTPHHLILNEGISVDGGPQSWAKVNPPLRSKENMKAAGNALIDGTIDVIGSDHAPHTLKEKRQESKADFFKCPSGFPGLETELGAIGGFLKKNFSDWEMKLIEVTSGNAARIFSLHDRGKIEVGKRGDLVILGGPAEVCINKFKTKAAYSPFNGMNLQISVYKTILGGKIG